MAQEITLIQPSEVGLSADRLDRISDVMEDYVDAKKIAGAVTLVARAGEVAHLGITGMQDVEAGKQMQEDTIFRIASMTKPITSVAVMMLFEEGHFLLTDPVAKYLPEFKDMRVLAEGSSDETEPAKQPITIRHLLTHTSGLAYQQNPRVGMRYKAAGVTGGLIEDPKTIAEGVKALAAIPLVHHPGEKFTYGLSIDVLGRHGVGLGGVDRESEARVVLGLASTVTCGDGDLSNELGEERPTLLVGHALLALDLGPLVMASHESSGCPGVGALLRESKVRRLVAVDQSGP